MKNKFLKTVTATLLSIAFLLLDCLPLTIQGIALAAPSDKPPNILVIMGDDIGWFNISAYNNGIMGYETPNIDSLAKEGVMFTDFYGEQSCTAGRAAFLTGQATIRTGMTKVGLPGINIGLQKEDPTLAELLKPLGYTSGQFGKNHLGDLDKYLPTNHGFDEFYGNLYHLNAEEEPENEDYPDEGLPGFDAFRPRGVIHSYADSDHVCDKGATDETSTDETDPDKYSYNQRVCDTGPLTKKRMETIDEDVLARTEQFITEAKDANKPFFAWFNTTRMHIFTHLKDESQGVTGQGIEGDGMVEHDGQVGELLSFITAQGLDDNTIIVYTTDNGAEVFSWPDGGTTPFRGEKNTNWEGGFRVPALIRWKNHFPEGVVSNEIMTHLDWVPTLMAAAGVENIQQLLLKDKNEVEHKQRAVTPEYPAYEQYDVHLDGYNFLPYLESLKLAADNSDYKETFKKNCLPTNLEPPPSYCPPRHEFIYFTDDGYPSAIRYDDWKLVFSETQGEGFEVWEEPYVDLRLPKLFNLRRDPFEKASLESSYYDDWRLRRVFLIGPIQFYIAKLLNTFVDYPPRQKPASFSINQIVDGVLTELKIDKAQEEFPVITKLRNILDKLQNIGSD